MITKAQFDVVKSAFETLHYSPAVNAVTCGSRKFEHCETDFCVIRRQVLADIDPIAGRERLEVLILPPTQPQDLSSEEIVQASPIEDVEDLDNKEGV